MTGPQLELSLRLLTTGRSELQRTVRPTATPEVFEHLIEFTNVCLDILERAEGTGRIAFTLGPGDLGLALIEQLERHRVFADYFYRTQPARYEREAVAVDSEIERLFQRGTDVKKLMAEFLDSAISSLSKASQARSVN
jgi:hypothetical protein